MDKVHPAAMLFPPLEGEEYSAFVESIRQQGQLVKGVRDKSGQLLDGRNRQRACQDLGIPFQYITYEGDDEVDFIVAANIRRRHLTSGQLGMLGNDLVPLYAVEAAARQKTGKAQAPSVPTLPPIGGKVSSPPKKSTGTAAAHAAKAVGTSTRIVERAHRIAKNAPEELAAEVRAGTLSLDHAEKVMGKIATPRAAPKQRSDTSKQNAVLKEALRYYLRKVENLEVYSKDTEFKGVSLLTSELRTDYIARLSIVCQNISKLISELENTNRKESQ